MTNEELLEIAKGDLAVAKSALWWARNERKAAPLRKKIEYLTAVLEAAKKAETLDALESISKKLTTMMEDSIMKANPGMVPPRGSEETLTREILRDIIRRIIPATKIQTPGSQTHHGGPDTRQEDAEGPTATDLLRGIHKTGYGQPKATPEPPTPTFTF